jgi:hypothetical protein
MQRFNPYRLGAVFLGVLLSGSITLASGATDPAMKNDHTNPFYLSPADRDSMPLSEEQKPPASPVFKTEQNDLSMKSPWINPLYKETNTGIPPQEAEPSQPDQDVAVLPDPGMKNPGTNPLY